VRYPHRVSEPAEALDAFLDAATVGDRIDALAGLVRRLGPAAAGGTGSAGADLDRLGDGAARAGLSRGLVALLSETDATALFGYAGIPNDRGFLAELGDRLSARLVPTPRDDRDLSRLVRRVYRSEADVERLHGASPAEYDRLVRLVVRLVPDEAWAPLRNAFADGFRLLLARVHAEGLSRGLRVRGSPGAVVDSPFHRVVRSGDALLAAWLASWDVATPVAELRVQVDACRHELRVVRRHLEDTGVEVDIVFGLEVIERCLTRASLMADIMEAPEGPERSAAIERLLAVLARSAHEDRSVLHLVKWNLHLLDRKIVDRSGETGEHYVACDRKEWNHIWLAAAGGGALTVLTAAVKLAVHGWHLAAFQEGLLYGLNYAASFLTMQAFGFVLATKQPAMTAATLANIIRETQGEDREEKIAVFFGRLTSSQIAAAASNVLTVGAGAAAFAWLWKRIAGSPVMAGEAARETLASLNPLHSGTIFFAALTGVLLWLGSIAGGWFENWTRYHRIPEGLAQHRLGRTLGRDRMRRLAAAFRHNVSGWATNVALGLLLGFAPAAGRFFGIPLDVRHVTLSTGTLALAAASLGEGWYAGGFPGAAAGVAVMFVLNLSVAFALSLHNAARAYEMPGGELLGVLRHVLVRALRRPLDLVRPPPDDAAAG